jgi:hypothetical protein
MRLPDKHEGLRDVLKVLASGGDATWGSLLGQVQAKLNERADKSPLEKRAQKQIRIELDLLGETSSQAIADLKPARSHALTTGEVSVYCRRGLKQMLALLKDYRQERQGPPKIGYAEKEPEPKPDGGKKRPSRPLPAGHIQLPPAVEFFYFLDAIKIWWQDYKLGADENKSIGSTARWNSVAAAQKRLSRAIADEAAAKKSRKENEAILAKAAAAAGLDINVQAFVENRAFLNHLTRPSHASGAAQHPWIVDASGQVLDSAWITFSTAENITRALTDGGTIQQLSLMTALKKGWSDGENWAFWRYVYSVYAMNIEREFDAHGAQMRSDKALNDFEFDPDKPTRDRVRS